MIVDRKLTDRFHLKGDWWINRRKNLKSFGDLVFNQQELSLGLNHPLVKRDIHELFDLDIQQRTIYGVSAAGELYTLFEAMESGTTMIDGHEWPDGYFGNVLAVGQHLSDLDFAAFTSARVKFDVLPYSLIAAGFKPTFEADKRTLIWEKAPTFITDIKSGRSLWRLGSQSECDMNVSWFAAEMKDASALVLGSRTKRSTRWYLERALELRSLFTVMSGQPVCTIQLELFESKSARPVGVFFRQNLKKPANDFYNLLVRLGPLSESVKCSVFNAYLNAREDLRVVIGLLCSTLYESSGYPRVDFLNLTQALEGFHRITADRDKYLSDDQYESDIREPLADAIPKIDEDLTQRLKSALKYGNEYSQRTRFRQLGEVLRDITGGDLVADPRKFSNRLCDTRNAFTHPGGDAVTSIDERDCVFANSGLQLALCLLLLRHFGVPADNFAGYKSHRLYRMFHHKRAW